MSIWLPEAGKAADIKFYYFMPQEQPEGLNEIRARFTIWNGYSADSSALAGCAPWPRGPLIRAQQVGSPQPISHPSARAPPAPTGDSPDPYHKQLLPAEWQTAPVLLWHTTKTPLLLGQPAGTAGLAFWKLTLKHAPEPLIKTWPLFPLPQ